MSSSCWRGSSSGWATLRRTSNCRCAPNVDDPFFLSLLFLLCLMQEAVSKFLPPVLLKLTSQNEGVRKKVMELLVHINKRIKNNMAIQLPVEALLLQYQVLLLVPLPI